MEFDINGSKGYLDWELYLENLKFIREREIEWWNHRPEWLIDDKEEDNERVFRT